MSVVLDTTLNIETPEVVELLLPVAGIAPRSLAWLIDSMIKIGIIFVAANILAAIENVGEGLLLLTMFGVIWGYNVLFEALMQGATPGKKIVGVHVMNADGTPIGWRGATLRNLLRPVDDYPGCYLFGCLSVLFTRNFQRLGDLAAGTVVVQRHEVPAKNPWDDVDPQPTLVPLTRDEQEAIVSFGERRNQISDARAEELSRIMQPVLGELDAKRLRAFAAWITGHRPKS